MTTNVADAKVPYTFQIPKPLHERLVAEAERRSSEVRRVTIAEVLRDLIDKAC